MIEEPVRKSRKERYHEYLHSEKWQSIKERVLARDKNRCRVCNSGKDVQVHHRSYSRAFGNESLNDLITLCNKCHYLFHKKGKLYKDGKESKKKTIKERKAIDGYILELQRRAANGQYVKELEWLKQNKFL